MVVNSIRLAICSVVQFQHKAYASACIEFAIIAIMRWASTSTSEREREGGGMGRMLSICCFCGTWTDMPVVCMAALIVLIVVSQNRKRIDESTLR